MSSVISGNYRELAPGEIQRVAQECANAWQDPEIPRRQFELAVKPELEALRAGVPCAPFSVLAKLLRKLPLGLTANYPRLLDVGASSGYYSEVLRLLNFKCDYYCVDFSEAFKMLAEELYPGIAFMVRDARQLRFPDKSYEIVLHGAVLMHCLEYPQAIREAVRVASKFVIFHRNPILLHQPTKYWLKEAYSVPCVEIHFNEDELLQMFKAHGLTLVHSENIFMDAATGFGHRSYLLAKA